MLFTFTRSHQVLTRSEVKERIRRVVEDEDDVEYYLQLLCDVAFLGVETADGFRFARDEGERDFLVAAASSVALAEKREERYRINAAFYDVLQMR